MATYLSYLLIPSSLRDVSYVCTVTDFRNVFLLIEAVIVARRTDMFVLVVRFFPFFPTVLIVSHAAIDSHPVPRDDAAAQPIQGLTM